MGATKIEWTRGDDGDPRTSGPGFGLTTHQDALTLPLRWKEPRRVFVNSMSDLFHADVPDDFIAQVFVTMARTPQHTYQILTKRHARMRSLVGGEIDGGHRLMEALADEDDAQTLYDAHWPLPNVWLGVSAEDQKWADLRIPALLDTAAAVRFVSAEPLLGPINLTRWVESSVPDTDCDMCGEERFADEIGVGHDRFIYNEDRSEEIGEEWCPGPSANASPRRLGWVITGGESGPGARPAHPAWFRNIRDQCTSADVAFFHKQHGAWIPESALLHHDTAPAAFLDVDGSFRPLVNGKPQAPPMARGDAITMRRVGKKAAGRELDGRTWDQYPTTTTAF